LEFKRNEKPQPESGGMGRGFYLPDGHVADRSPMTLAATPVSTAAERQHDHDDNQN
jgi:hypothetical protein